MCTANPTNCEINSRMIIKRIKADCIRNLIEKKVISIKLG